MITKNITDVEKLYEIIAVKANIQRNCDVYLIILLIK